MKFSINFFSPIFLLIYNFISSWKFTLYIYSSMVQCIAQSTALITDFSNKRNYVDARMFTFVTYGSSAKIHNLCVPLFFTPTDFLLPLSSASVGRKNTVSSFGHIKQWTLVKIFALNTLKIIQHIGFQWCLFFQFYKRTNEHHMMVIYYTIYWHYAPTI